jgi:outer membrane receptor protein involved in Fe transport
MGVSIGRESSALIGAGVLALTLAPAAPAQEAATQNPAAAVEEVVVTGSRIVNVTGMSTPTPVTAVSGAELQDMAPGTVVQALSKLPQFYGNTNNDFVGGFFGSPGSGNLNLRGLNTGGASSRTLTLLDGRRVVPGTGKGGVDTNILPESLIRRVDTVTGGASAAYGTDAVAGVVNFVLDTDYTGWQFRAQTGTTSRGDHDTSELGATYGVDIGTRGHLLLSAEHYEADGVFGFDDRDWYQSYGTINGADPAGPRLLIRPDVVSAISTFGGLINGGVPTTSALFRRYFNPDGSLSPFVLGEGTLSGGGTSHSIANGGSGDYIGADIQSISPNTERGNAFLYFDYDVKPNLNLYVQAMTGLSETDQPDHGGRFNGGLTGAGTSLTIFRENAFLPAAVRQIMVNENLNSFQLNMTGDRTGLGRESILKQDNRTDAATLGFKWDIVRDGFLEGWRVDGYAQYGEADNQGDQQGVILDRIEAAVDAVVDPAGNIVCRAATLNPAKWGGCVPLNLFGQGNASDAAIAYVTRFNAGQQITTPLYFNPSGYAGGETITYTAGYGKVYNTATSQSVAEISTSGDVVDGWGAGPIAAAFGLTYRKEELEQIVYDPSNPASDPTVFPAADPALRGVSVNIATRSSAIQNSTVPNIKGSYDVKEAFTEWLVPLVADKAAAKHLNLLAAGRYADYEGSGGIWAWKYGLDWQVIEPVRLRGTVSRDVRAATLAERFDQTGGIGSVNPDPQFPNDGTQGFTIRSGGNPNLAPEEADTQTIGVVYQPTGLEGLSLSVDYWDIEIAGAIGTLGLQRIVDDCYRGAQEMCALITRDPATGRLVQVVNVSQNIAAAAGQGVDLEFSYNRPIELFRTGNENLGVRLFYSHLTENSTTTDPTNPTTKVNLAGQTGPGGVLPEDTVTANVNYTNGKFNVFLQGRYIEDGLYNVRFNLPTAARPDIDDNTVDSSVYVDLTLGYTWNVGGGRLHLSANALNVLDEDPNVVASFDGALAQTSNQMNSALFDPLGRRFTLGLDFRF